MSSFCYLKAALTGPLFSFLMYFDMNSGDDTAKSSIKFMKSFSFLMNRRLYFMAIAFFRPPTADDNAAIEKFVSSFRFNGGKVRETGLT